MENEKPPNDIRMIITVGLFFLCIVGGGVFLGLYVFRPTSPPWYAVAGIVMVGIPWVVWLLAYLYSCFKIYRNACAMDNNAGRVFPKANTGQRPRSMATENIEEIQSPESPAQNSPNGNNQQVQFGDVLLEENSNLEQEGIDGSDHDGKKGSKSEIPLEPSASS